MIRDLIIQLENKIELSENSSKWYRILAAGVMYSKKYSGVWDANPEIFCNEEKPGKIEIRLNYLQAVYDNFIKGENETLPFVDFDHDRKKSCGPISALKLENGVLYAQPAWNELGKKTVSDKQYMYFSPRIGSHTNSKDGREVWPVLSTISLTNEPVIKDQNVIELSENAPKGKTAGTGKNDKKVTKKQNGGKTMDELLKLIAELAVSIKSAIEADETGAVKAALGAAIDHLETSCGLATEEQEEKEATAAPAEELKEKTPPAAALPGENKDKVTQMSETEISLSEENKKLAERTKALELKLSEADFDREYLNKKITPAQKPAMFALYLSDKKNAEAILSTMPALNLTKEQGSSSDISLSNFKDQGDARKTFDKKALELSEKDKISPAEAADRLAKSEPALFAVAYPVIKKEA